MDGSKTDVLKFLVVVSSTRADWMSRSIELNCSGNILIVARLRTCLKKKTDKYWSSLIPSNIF
jgi:hypothetical protein